MVEQAVADRIGQDPIGSGGQSASGPSRPPAATLALAFIVLLNALVGGLAMSAYLSASRPPVAEKDPAVAREAPGVAAGPALISYHVPDLLVTLNGAESRPTRVKISLAVEVEDQATVARLDMVMPLLVDAFQVYLGEFGVEDLEGVAGADRLREAFLMRVNAAIRPATVREVRLDGLQVQSEAAPESGRT
jgi:flagellar FliL protein